MERSISYLRIEAARQRYKQTTEFVYLGGAISESADLDVEIKRRIGAAWASVRKYSSQLYDRRNARLSLKIMLFKAEVMEAMLYGCATWTMRSQDFSSLRTAHHKLLCKGGQWVWARLQRLVRGSETRHFGSRAARDKEGWTNGICSSRVPGFLLRERSRWASRSGVSRERVDLQQLHLHH